MNTKTQPVGVTELRRQGEEGPGPGGLGGHGLTSQLPRGHGGAWRVPAKEGFPEELIKRRKPFQLRQERLIVHENKSTHWQCEPSEVKLNAFQTHGQ